MGEVTREEALAAIRQMLRKVHDSMRAEMARRDPCLTLLVPTGREIAANFGLSPEMIDALYPPPILELWAGEPAPRDIQKGERFILKFR